MFTPEICLMDSTCLTNYQYFFHFVSWKDDEKSLFSNIVHIFWGKLKITYCSHFGSLPEYWRKWSIITYTQQY